MAQKYSVIENRNENTSVPDLCKLAEQFNYSSFQHSDKQTLLKEFLQRSINLINSAGAVYFSVQNQQVTAEVTLLARQMQELGSDLVQKMAACAAKATQQSRACYEPIDNKNSLFCACCPLPETSSCLAVLLVTDTDSLSPFLLTLQLLTALLEQFLRMPPGHTEHSTLQLLDILAPVLSQPPGKERLIVFNQSIKNFVGADFCALALTNDVKKIRIKALSDIISIDIKTERIRLLVKGAHECALRNSILSWPPIEETAQPSMILEEIGHNNGGNQAVALPFTRDSEKPALVLIFVWKNVIKDRALLATITKHSMLLSCLISCADISKKNTLLGRPNQSLSKWSLQQKITAAVAVLLLLILFLPVPYRLQADVITRPHLTRFVVAHYDGLLQKTVVRPGDAVTKGQILARLDAREIKVKLAGLQAERDKAKKQQDQATALGNTAAAQVAHLEMLQYQHQLTQLQDRLDQLTIISPVTGIILSGDLHRSEGSPVNRGQTLFEVAPLIDMEVEVAIAEKDISRILPASTVIVRFDAYPNRVWKKQLQRIEPRTQIRRNQNVFIGVLQFANPENNLRPGMSGKATIDAGKKTLGWIILHKPWNTLLRLIDRIR